jgi:hypothetical protein
MGWLMPKRSVIGVRICSAGRRQVSISVLFLFFFVPSGAVPQCAPSHVAGGVACRRILSSHVGATADHRQPTVATGSMGNDVAGHALQAERGRLGRLTRRSHGAGLSKKNSGIKELNGT